MVGWEGRQGAGRKCKADGGRGGAAAAAPVLCPPVHTPGSRSLERPLGRGLSSVRAKHLQYTPRQPITSPVGTTVSSGTEEATEARKVVTCLRTQLGGRWGGARSDLCSNSSRVNWGLSFLSWDRGTHTLATKGQRENQMGKGGGTPSQARHKDPRQALPPCLPRATAHHSGALLPGVQGSSQAVRSLGVFVFHPETQRPPCH